MTSVILKPEKNWDIVEVLRHNGWVLVRQGKGSHELWGLPDASVVEPISRHGPGGEISAGVIGKLIKKLGDTSQGWR